MIHVPPPFVPPYPPTTSMTLFVGTHLVSIVGSVIIANTMPDVASFFVLLLIWLVAIWHFYMRQEYLRQMYWLDQLERWTRRRLWSLE